MYGCFGTAALQMHAAERVLRIHTVLPSQDQHVAGSAQPLRIAPDGHQGDVVELRLIAHEML
jgi:hypothetical protein